MFVHRHQIMSQTPSKCHYPKKHAINFSNNLTVEGKRAIGSSSSGFRRLQNSSSAAAEIAAWAHRQDCPCPDIVLCLSPAMATSTGEPVAKKANGGTKPGGVVNLAAWIAANEASFAPPVCNKLLCATVCYVACPKTTGPVPSTAHSRIPAPQPPSMHVWLGPKPLFPPAVQ